MKFLRKTKVGCCLMTGIKFGTSFVGYSINNASINPTCAPTAGTNRLTDYVFGKAEYGWTLYGCMSKSRNRFLGYCVAIKELPKV